MLPWVNQSSTPQCTQCLRWGHSCASCQMNFSYCAICSGRRHMTMDHTNSRLHGESSKYDLACINCLMAGMAHDHKATDRTCPFFMECNNKQHITQLLTTIRARRLEGYENPFGLTKVRHTSSSTANSYDSSASAWKHIVATGNYPTQFLTSARLSSSTSAEESLRLASSSESLFRHVPDISHSQVMQANPTGPQENTITL